MAASCQSRTDSLGPEAESGAAALRQSVEVYVDEREPAFMLVDEREGRARYISRIDIETGCEPFGKDRLARAEFAIEQK